MSFFSYQQSFDGTWIPVITSLHPNQLSFANGKEGRFVHVQVHEITDDSLTLDQLQDLYPLNDPLKKGRNNAINKMEGRTMSRPVTGFLSAHGQFFEDETDADFFDAAHELTRICDKFAFSLSNALLDGNMSPKEASNELSIFIKKETTAIQQYINALNAVHDRDSKKAGDNESLRPASTGLSEDDERIRDEDNTEMDSSTATEDDTTDAGTKVKQKTKSKSNKSSS